MALTAQSLFLYGYTITAANRNFDFRAVAAETPRQAVLNLGYYSLGGLMRELTRAIGVVDATNMYTITADRTVSGGLQNRVTIATSGAFFSILFASGPNTATNCAAIFGYTATDKTGALTYTGTLTTGTVMRPNSAIPWMYGYNFIQPGFQPMVSGSLNIAASGNKEEVIFNVQNFWNVEFKYITQTEGVTDWTPLITWMTYALPLEFTPLISSPSTIYEGTLETSSSSGKGMAFLLQEMLPDFPNIYRTGMMKFRQRLSS